MNILLIDNYDSFIYNLKYDLELLGAKVTVCRNDTALVELEVLIEENDAIILSPGPGKPSESGCCPYVIKTHQGSKPILGICLGHQAIVEVLGGTVGASPEMMHGKTSQLQHEKAGLFERLPQGSTIARYHSLEALKMPNELQIDSVTESGAVMAVSNPEKALYGLQFHPESIMSKDGSVLLAAFLAQSQTFIDNSSKHIGAS